MAWIQANWRIAAAVLAGIVWTLQRFGPTIWDKLKAAASRLRQTGQQTTGLLSSWPLIVAAVLLGPLLFPAPSPVPVNPPPPPDLVESCAAAHRQLVADAVESFASEKFADTTAAEEWINEKLLDCYEAAYEPVHSKIGEAKKAGRVTDCATAIRAGDLHE